MLTEEKTNRSEYISLWVTPEVKKEFDAAKSHADLEEQIIRDFIKREANWIEEEMEQVDEAAIRYKSRLLKIKDTFSKIQDDYVDEINNIYLEAEKSINKVDKLYNDTLNAIRKTYEGIDKLKASLTNISTYGLENLLNAADRFNNMSQDQKELISLLLSKNEK